ncbi:hypothetical protein [Candidatus Methanoliparum sp. LAM-1]|uniref:hypothetical protein n=1 Tax=Candidatus Methanoliparum sp. LAM-1 TaxID=2874846 RepID=UPI001E49BB05|nr:hypothetical protein [Candidatus Methanoliparum sp. LAM-1]BDC35426.1 hypothetical protein MTLP_01080 [Candidatus Methanoliparum sp. LAM-1]
MTKTEQIYKVLLRKKVVSTDEVVAAAEKVLKTTLRRAYVDNEYIRKLESQKKVSAH